jgi:hypothetical protein
MSMGDELFNQVTEATGLPQEWIANELGNLLAAAGVERSELTIDDLRRVLSDYVQDVLLQAHDQYQTAAGE